MNMPKGTPVTFFERERIEAWLRMKKKKIWIARRLGRDYSVIKREIKRNKGVHLPYLAIRAEEYTKRRKHNTNKRKLEKWQNVKLKEYVEEKLRDGYSPEEIAGRLREQPPQKVQKCEDTSVSYETIYRYVYEGEGQYGGLYKKLRRKQKVRQRRFDRKPHRERIPDRVSIHERPQVVRSRKRFGDWETDSVIFSKQHSVLSVQYERKMKLCRLKKVVDKTALESERAIQKHLSRLPEYLRRSITRDNGTENVLHAETKKKFGIASYFCDPYKSWQKGGVENLNGLIREYFPKRCHFDDISDAEVYAIQEKLNNRPRKTLNYLTPNEVFATLLKKGH
jgi:transposase, IS30 family